MLVTELAKVGVVVMDIAQNIADLGREFADKDGSFLIVGPIGRGEGGG